MTPSNLNKIQTSPISLLKVKKLKYIIFLTLFFIFPQNISAQILGDIKANVVDKVLVSGKGTVIVASKNSIEDFTFKIDSNPKFDDDNLIYKVESEPNSSITIHYNLLNNKVGMNNFGKINLFGNNSRIVRLDKFGKGELSIKSSLFFDAIRYNNRRNLIAYTITLMY